MNTFTLKSGTNKGNRRIWIEGKRLIDAGLLRGWGLARQMNDDGSMTLSTAIDAEGKRHTIAGKADRPILDLCGKWVTEFIGDHTHFTVEVLAYSDADRDMVDLVINPVTI